MKAIGAFLLILGLAGLVLNLIFWQTAQFNLFIVFVISAVCLLAVWGGGKLFQPGVVATQRETAYTHINPQETGRFFQPAATACPKCGSQIVPGQQFCGGCGSSLVTYCARCGNAISEPSRFCGRCGAKLS
jgi:hypothetical protein